MYKIGAIRLKWVVKKLVEQFGNIRAKANYESITVSNERRKEMTQKIANRILKVGKQKKKYLQTKCSN